MTGTTHLHLVTHLRPQDLHFLTEGSGLLPIAVPPCQNNGRLEMTDKRRRPEMTDRSQHVRR